MDEILHHYETIGNHCLLVFTEELSLQGFLGGAKWILPSTVSHKWDGHPSPSLPPSPANRKKEDNAFPRNKKYMCPPKYWKHLLRPFLFTAKQKASLLSEGEGGWGVPNSISKITSKTRSCETSQKSPNPHKLPKPQKLPLLRQCCLLGGFPYLPVEKSPRRVRSVAAPNRYVVGDP